MLSALTRLVLLIVAQVTESCRWVIGSKTSVVQQPYSQSTTASYSYQDPLTTQAGQDLKAWNPEIDPGIQARSDLAQQENANRWNSDFTSGLPLHVKMRLQDSSARQLAQGANLERQQGEYLKNNLELGKRQALLPQLVQTSGTNQGYNSQIIQKPSIWSSIIGGAAAVAPFLLSDERVKNVRGAAPVGLNEVQQLQPAQYQYKPEAGLDEGQEHQGLVAQDVEGVIPEAVAQDEQGLKGVDYEAVTAALINAVKQLKMEVDGMKQGGASNSAPMQHRPMGGGMYA